jgi:hypothetical protein
MIAAERPLHFRGTHVVTYTATRDTIAKKDWRPEQ